MTNINNNKKKAVTVVVSSCRMLLLLRYLFLLCLLGKFQGLHRAVCLMMMSYCCIFINILLWKKDKCTHSTLSVSQEVSLCAYIREEYDRRDRTISCCVVMC